MHFMCRATLFGDFFNVFAGAERVSRAKIAPDLIEVFATSTEKRAVLPRNACQQRQRSSEKAAHRVKRACNDAFLCFDGFARASAAVAALIFKFLHARALAKMGIRDLDASFAIFHTSTAATLRAFKRMFSLAKDG